MATNISDNKYSAFTTTCPDLIFITNMAGECDTISPGIDHFPKSFENIFQIFPNINFADRITPYIKLTIENGISSVWEFQNSNVDFEVRLSRIDFQRCLILVRDISKWKETERSLEEKIQSWTSELQRSNDELRQFAYAASHDLREPLNKIRAFGNRLKSQFSHVLNDNGKNYLEVMISASDRMMALIDDLLSYTRVEKRESPLQWTSLHDIFQQILDDLSEKIQATKGAIEISEGFPRVWADPQQMYLLFQNLINNALKFYKPDKNPQIEIFYEENAEFITVFVKDFGIGFDPKFKSRIFGIFERLHSHHDYPGTGIGLALCKRIVDRHQGSITVESCPGKGTCFCVKFPVKKV